MNCYSFLYDSIFTLSLVLRQDKVLNRSFFCLMELTGFRWTEVIWGPGTCVMLRRGHSSNVFFPKVPRVFPLGEEKLM